MSRNTQPIEIIATGLVTSVGLDAPATCAATRAKVSNPAQTGFVDSKDQWIEGHYVSLDEPWRGRIKLAKMIGLAIKECLENVSNVDWPRLPLLLCVAEHSRPGRLEGLDDQLALDIEQELGVKFAPPTTVIAHGRASGAVALQEARRLVHEANAPMVLIAATDSLLSWPTLKSYEAKGRLLTEENSDGFMPGEGAGALLVGAPTGKAGLLCRGIGSSFEKVHIESTEPLRADGLVQAVNSALAEASMTLADTDFRVTDLAGEQYYFKEAALLLTRVLRQRKPEFDLWHPAECTGEIGAAAGILMVAVAEAACRKAYAPGSGILMHLGNDDGRRAAVVFTFEGR